MVVYQALLQSRFRDATIIIFTSDHGDLLGSHAGMHQKWYTAYEEAIRVPLIVTNQRLFRGPGNSRQVDEPRRFIADDARHCRSRSGIDPRKAGGGSERCPPACRPRFERHCVGNEGAGSSDDGLYFMNDDDPSRGPDQVNWVGICVGSIVQPNHIETVIATLDDGTGPKIWKHSRYFDRGRSSMPLTSARWDIGAVRQYDFGRPSTRSAMWLRINCGLTGAMRAIWISRK
jgi:choline-sulfatase